MQKEDLMERAPYACMAWHSEHAVHYRPGHGAAVHQCLCLPDDIRCSHGM